LGSCEIYDSDVFRSDAAIGPFSRSEGLLEDLSKDSVEKVLLQLTEYVPKVVDWGLLNLRKVSRSATGEAPI
jgi:hypothetical protein